ncbi:MAG: protein kinase domain-containing protein [Limisphaerales bacterium]
MTEPSPCSICGKPVAPQAPRGLCPACLMQAGLATATQGDDPDTWPAVAPPPVAEIAGLFPQLEILEVLGRGGMGAVYKARQPRLDRFVALKILLRRSPDGERDSDFAERFAREARALARLNHPNIVAVYDFGQAGGYSFLLMEYVEGVTLRQLLRRGKLASEQALDIVPQICEALQFAHEQGVIHRDIKPENILLNKEGRVKIGDFGIAKIAGPAAPAGLTQEQQVIGTPHYMAPEQVEKPQSVDHRADIYSLGVVFYEMLTGELPLGKFAPPSHKSWADSRLDQVVLHALEKEPERRYQQASEVKTAVEHLDDPPAAPVPLPGPAGNAASRFLLAAAAVLLVLLICAGAVWMLLPKNAKPSEREPGEAAPPLKVERRSTPDERRPGETSPPLNAEQRLVQQWTEERFQDLLDNRTFAGWSDAQEVALEHRLIETLKGPRSDQYYKAISSLGSLRRSEAVPSLLAIAADRRVKDNRDRWMATRALGMLADKRVVPELIHLTYHPNVSVHWWAQIALVQLTGTNFGGDWRAWGRWWNQTGGQPPFHPAQARWTSDPHASDPVALQEHDRQWLKNISGGRYTPTEAPVSGAASLRPAATANLEQAATQPEMPEPSQPVRADSEVAQPSAKSDLAMYPTPAAAAFDQPNEHKPTQDHPAMTDQNASWPIGGFIFLAFVLVILLALYLFFCSCCKRICQKAGRGPGALIWIPILQAIPLLQVAGMATWMIVLFLIPLVNLVVAAAMWARICAALGKSPWLVVLLFIPLVNLAFIPYLAFANGEPASVATAPANPGA